MMRVTVTAVLFCLLSRTMVDCYIRGSTDSLIAGLRRLRDSVTAAETIRDRSQPSAICNQSSDSVNYGYLSTNFNTGENLDRVVPPSALRLGIINFRRELKNIVQKSSRADVREVGNPIQQKIASLTLSNANIWARERARPSVKSPLVIKLPYYILCYLLDFLFEGMPISRFYFLEVVARMPYFSYITMLHTYETLGWWRRSVETKRVHFAEELNEYHHLLIWESLGGDQLWRVRFLAQHSAIIYYFGLILLWVLSPTLAYNFSELIEAHAVDTYTEFAEANRAILESLPAPAAAKAYYEASDLYAFDEFQTSRPRGSRRPKIATLYDAVCNIRNDEVEHVRTMAACQDPDVVRRSPDTEAAITSVILAIIAAVVVFANAPQELGAALTTTLTRATRALESLSNTIAGGGAEEQGAEQLENVLEEGAPSLLEVVKALISRLRP